MMKHILEQMNHSVYCILNLLLDYIGYIGLQRVRVSLQYYHRVIYVQFLTALPRLRLQAEERIKNQARGFRGPDDQLAAVEPSSPTENR
jgi:hypothetical protein